MGEILLPIIICVYSLNFYNNEKKSIDHGFISGLSILFHQPVSLSLCQDHDVLMLRVETLMQFIPPTNELFRSGADLAPKSVARFKGALGIMSWLHLCPHLLFLLLFNLLVGCCCCCFLYLFFSIPPLWSSSPL